MGDQVLVRDTGFGADDWQGGFVALADGFAANAPGLEMTPADDAAALSGHLDRVEIIRIGFPGFADGRGFTLARQLRALGYKGRLRAFGHVLADQYAMARRAGFDEVEISADLAARQPEDQWQARANWRDHDYQARLRG
ncbi:DUF934 domain-containing protein [Rhodophyticola sp. CCM32]|uniref:DUF934 domain-containing protein n=1 Tax=Rhodophyticola sp. CCM32 TaxID=2916397 RepID=UPI00107F7C5A|nr:DUF934 domain-containing protein [Rhodophyticola sp. CCM32]QBY02690.1 DUF934 domain-containing protein [Rhodophyticola sp. CCM32]